MAIFDTFVLLVVYCSSISVFISYLAIAVLFDVDSTAYPTRLSSSAVACACSLGLPGLMFGEQSGKSSRLTTNFDRCQ